MISSICLTPATYEAGHRHGEVAVSRVASQLRVVAVQGNVLGPRPRLGDGEGSPQDRVRAQVALSHTQYNHTAEDSR